MTNLEYTVIKDTREKLGWDFLTEPYCKGMVVKTLKTGDYSLEGLEDMFTIERKGSIAEFARNVVQSRFEKELCRMEHYKYKFMILEFSMNDILRFPIGSNIPHHQLKKTKITNQFILMRLMQMEIQYGTKIILAGTKGAEVASSLFKRVMEHYVHRPNY